MTDETHRFFKFSSETSYDQLTAAGNTARNLPDDNGTERWLSLWSDLFLDPETNSDKLYCIKRSLILDSDDFSLEGIEELNLETYLERLHWEEPVVIEEPEELLLDEPWTN